MEHKKELVLGLAGYGVVGTGLARALEEAHQLIPERTGRSLRIKTILVRDVSRPREWPVPEGARLTTSLEDLLGDPEIDVVVELIGGTTTARDILRRALEAGKHVVTANKALLAENGEDLFRLAAAGNLHLGFEASVAGGIPIVHTLRNGLAANRILSLSGILNGTCNYILSEMTHKGIAFNQALSEAQQLGFAEADPTLDVGGFDAAHKLVLLIRLAWGVEYPYTRLPVQGIDTMDPVDIAFARELGYRIKLLGHARMTDNGLEAGVFPTLLHESFLLSSVDGAFNAIRVKGSASRSVFLHGRGAGATPTGSAVLSDLLDIARDAKPNNTGFLRQTPFPATIHNPDEDVDPYYFRLQVPDNPGVLRDVAGAMAENGISIAHAIQKGQAPDIVPLVFMTHKATALAVKNALARLEELGLLRAAPVCYRVLAPE